MRLASLALAAAVPVASSALPAAPPPASRPAVHPPGSSAIPSRLCGDDLKVRPVGSQASRPRRLGELPSGDLTLAVVNRVGDCIEPVTLRQGYGLGGR